MRVSHFGVSVSVHFPLFTTLPLLRALFHLLFHLLSVTIIRAVLGTKIQVPKLYGAEGEKVEVCIEPGIQPNTVIRMPNQGMTKSNCKKKRGDLFIHILIDIPTHLTQQQKDLWERLATIDSMLDLHLTPSPSSPPSSPLPVVTKSHSTSSLPNAVLLKTEK